MAVGSSAQKAIGYGGEFSVLSAKTNVRLWISKNTGFEVFGGIATELDYFKLNDVEAGFKILKTIIYNRSNRTYWGVVGKWKWVDVDYSFKTTNLPVFGFLIGKEWYNKRIHRKSYAVEIGYQYGQKTYQVTDPNGLNPKSTDYTEFPLILNLRYSFYQLRK